jgi:hypothetical protein
MATFEVGKTYYYYYSAYFIHNLKIVKKTKCFVELKGEIGNIEKKKIRYTDNNEEYIIFRRDGMIREHRLYSSCIWNKYWKIKKNEEGEDIIIKSDFTQFYKMDTATLKMYKFICNKWDINNNLMPIHLLDEYLYFEDIIKRHVEENTEDFDKDYYSLYYTANINWCMIDTKYKQNYILKHTK